jgi:hypothetical protein
MDDYSFAVGLLRQKENFRKNEKNEDQLIFCGEDNLNAEERYRLVSLIYRKLGGERYMNIAGVLTLYYERDEGFCYIGLYHTVKRKPLNRFCLAGLNRLAEEKIDIFAGIMVGLDQKKII